MGNNISSFETWEDVENSDGFKVSSNGDIKNVSGKYIKFHDNLSGYLTCNIIINGSWCKRYIHRLVANAFVGNVDNMQVDHIDGDKYNNHFTNLRICTNRQNQSFDNVKRTKASQFVGVMFRKNIGKWRSIIRLNGKRKELGQFNSEYEAHLAYQSELNKHLIAGGI